MVLITTKILIMECKQQTPVLYFETWWFMSHGSPLQTEHNILRPRFFLLDKDAGTEIPKFPFSAFLLIFLKKSTNKKVREQEGFIQQIKPALTTCLTQPCLQTETFSPQLLLRYDATRRHKTIHVKTEVWFLKPC